MRIERDQARVAVLICAGAVVFAVGAWWPQYRREQALGRRIALAQQEIQNDDGPSADLAGLARQVADLQSTLDASAQHLSQPDELAEALKYLSARMEALHLTDQQIVTGSLRSEPHYAILPLTLQFRASFPSAFALVKEIESMPRLARVVRLSLANDASRTDRPVAVSLEMELFFTPTPTARQEGKP